MKERRSCWIQNQTWPFRLPKMVPIAMDFEGRGGAIGKIISSAVLVAADSWESLSCFWVSWVLLRIDWSSVSSLREALRRRLVVMGVILLVAAAEGGLVVVGERHGRKNRRRASSLVMVGFLGQMGVGILTVEGNGRAKFFRVRNSGDY